MRNFWIVLVATVAAALVAIAVFAQTPPKYQFEQTASSLAEANGYSYHEYRNGATTGTVLSVTCVATAAPTTFTCTAPIPTFDPNVPFNAQIGTSNVIGEAKSAVIGVGKPGAPGNVRIIG